MNHQEEMRKAFIADIAANPEDLARRLIFADWLEDNGEPEWAEFIRVQIELDKLPYAKDVRETDFRFHEDGVSLQWRHAFLLHDAEMRLLWKHHPTLDCAFWETWCYAEARRDDGTPCTLTDRGYSTVTPHGSAGLGGNSCGCTIEVDSGRILQKWRNGFIEEVHAPLTVLEEHLPRIVQEHPLLVVRATDREPQEDREAFCWYREGSYVARETAMIPEEVWLRLENDDDNDIPARCRFCAYRTSERAQAALSKALLKLARGKVVSPEAPA